MSEPSFDGSFSRRPASFKISCECNQLHQETTSIIEKIQEICYKKYAQHHL